MCTVSIIGLTQPGPRGRATPCGFRLITNRDELRTRPLATAPRWHDRSMSVVGAADADAAAYFPVDPAGGGTWVGASRRGLALCLLNANPLPAPPLPPRESLISRGIIIPQLLASLTDEDDGRSMLDRAMDLLERMELRRFAPFRLVGVQAVPGEHGHDFRVREAKWDLASLLHETAEQGPACFVSSALGDPLVKPRLALFDAMVRGPFAAPGQAQALAQDRFHRHVWAGRSEISVLMSRSDARTVSISTVEVAMQAGAPVVSMRYEPVQESVVATTGAPVLSIRRSPH